MSKKQIIRQTIWEYQRDHIELLYQNRGVLKSRKSRIGINISIIMHSAFFIEGYLECELKALVSHRGSILNKKTFEEFYLRRMYNAFIHNIEKDLSVRISRARLKEIDPILKILSYKTKPDKLKDFKYYEGIGVLFKLRNVLAHGREVAASRVSGCWTDGSWEDEFGGGYEAAESYLIKGGMLKNKFVECHNIEHIVTNKVADHFHSISRRFLKHCSNIFQSEKDEASVSDVVMEQLYGNKSC